MIYKHTVKKETQIPGTDLILEEGDRIEIKPKRMVEATREQAEKLLKNGERS